MKKRVGERIQAEISEFYANEVLLPTTLVEYDQGFKEMILLNKAHTIMLMEEQIIEKQAAAKILEGLDRVWHELKRDDLDGAYEELYFNVQKSLFDRIRIEVGGKLHTGRSRNDIYATLTRMEVRRSLWEVMQRVIDLQQVLITGASEDIDTVITENNFSRVTALADFLVRKFKIPFWQAHDIVGDMIRRVHDSGRLMDGLTSRLLKDVAQEIFQLDLKVDSEEIQACLDPEKNVQSKISEGSPGRKSVEQMLSEANEYLSDEKNWLQKEMKRVESAYQQIDEAQFSLIKA